MSQSHKAAFTRPVDVDQFVKDEQRRHPWMPHSVALLIVSPRIDQVGLIHPMKAAKRDAPQVRVPPQSSLEELRTVRMTAAGIGRQVLTTPFSLEELFYLGSARGNKYHANQVDSYGKWIHWVGIHLRRTRGVFRKNTTLSQFGHWCSANQLLAMDTYAMSERKYQIVLQALITFTLLGKEGKLTQRAAQRLAA